MIEQLALLRILALGGMLLCTRQDGRRRREMRWTTFDRDVRFLMMAHWNCVGVWVVKFRMRPWTRVGRSRYLESTRELVRVCVLGVVRDGVTWSGYRVWSSGRNGCGGKCGWDGTFRPILGFCRAINAREERERCEVKVGYAHIGERTHAAVLR